jgi:imidazolonepropionase-like amidohydrolase
MRSRLLTARVILAAALGAAACSARRTVDADLALENVTVLPMSSDVTLPSQTVLVKDGKILDVGPSAELACGAGCTKVDGTGKFLLPGLADMHVHVWAEAELSLYVANGVTLVRNMWGEPVTLAMRRRVEEGSVLGPRIVTAGRLVDGDPPIWGEASAVATTAERARALMDEQKAAGYDFFKVYSRLSPEVFDAIAAHAREIGFPFAGHVPSAVPLDHALDSGMATMEHLIGWSEATRRTDGPYPSQASIPDWKKRGEAVAALARRMRAGELSWSDVVDPERRRAIAAHAAAKKVWQVPTLIVNRRIHTSRRQAAELLARPEMRYVAPEVRASWNPDADFRMKGVSDEDQELVQLFFEEDLRRVKALSEAGAPILAGTDAPNPFVIPGFAIHEELASLVEAGLTRYEALVTATRAPAEFLGESTKAGTVETGKRADLLLLDANPLEDIAATRGVAGVVLRGHWLPRAELDKVLQSVADGYAPNKDWFEGMTPLPEGDAAAFKLIYSDAEIGAERGATTRRDGLEAFAGQRRTKSGGDLATEIISFEQGKVGAPSHLSYRLTTPSGTAEGEATIDATSVSLSGHSLDGKAVARSIPRERAIVICDLVTCLSPVVRALGDVAIGGRRELSVLVLDSFGELRFERETWSLTRAADDQGLRIYEGVRKRGTEETGVRLAVGEDGVRSLRQTLKIGVFEARR